MNKKDIKKNLLPYVFLLVFFIGCLVAFKMFNNTVNELTYDEFLQDLNGGKITELTITPKVRTDTYKLTGKLDEYKDNEYFILYIPQSEEFISKITAAKEGTGSFKLTIINDPEASSWLLVIANVVPYIILGGLVIWVFTKQLGGGNKSMDFGKSRAKLVEESKATFKDVAGLTEEKEEVQELIDFLKNPKKFTSMGARIPKGVLLVGPPGTGKTLLARAVAGEAKVPFYYISGSDFVELFVGIGASRVRDLFKQAEQNAPCIVFIDEIDSIGKSRDSRYGGGNDEREQTLNALLAEMDGFDTSKGILILAATNRPEVLDPALLRPGRFDRRIIVDAPDFKGRLETLRVHSKDVKLDETVDLDAIANITSGAVGSDLANMVNEAAINAVKCGRRAISQADLMEAVEVVIAGKEKKDRILSKEEKKIVSYHEVGHALVTALQKHAEPVQKITIVPRTMGSLGYVIQAPEEEKYLMSKEELNARLVTFLAGRAAEEIVFDSVTTGASNDMEKATKIARSMIAQYGMSEKFGLMSLEQVENPYLGNRTTLNCSDKTATEIEEEVKILLKEKYEEAKKLLRNNRTKLDKIAKFLYEKETITGKEFMDIFEQCEREEAEKAEASKTQNTENNANAENLDTQNTEA